MCNATLQLDVNTAALRLYGYRRSTLDAVKAFSAASAFWAPMLSVDAMT